MNWDTSLGIIVALLVGSTACAKTWFQLLERVQKIRHKGSFIFENFFNWYAPFFSAYSFVLARMDEYEADRCAVQLAGVQKYS